MRIKKNFEIKGNPWSVEYKWGLRHEDGTLCDGLCEFHTRTIWLRRELSVEDKWSAFLHELTHAILHEAHINQVEGGVNGIVEEIICEAIPAALIGLFNFKWKRIS